jgi:4-hydroxybenzoate polyprenyltransferase
MSRRPRVSALLSCIRYDEVLVLQGSPLMGVAFSIGPITAEKLGTSALFVAASFLLVAHIFTFNDWAAAAYDLKDPNRSKALFQSKGISRGLLFLLSIFLLVASLLLFALLQPRTFLPAAAIAALGIFYSSPRFSAKTTPLVSSFPHLAGGLLHFLLGYALFTEIDERGVLIAIFFALTFTAGHLNHEVRDYEPDQQNGLRTNAVVFGKQPAFFAGLAVFTLAYGYLLLLAWFELVPRPLAIVPILLCPLHIFWSMCTLRDGLSLESVSRFQNKYRLLYTLIGLSMLVALFYQ